jgi:dimethylhistidine N-methyltransferase
MQNLRRKLAPVERIVHDVPGLHRRRDAASRARLAAVAVDVRAGLFSRPKRLPPWLFYDAIGSELFEEITRLPEYYLTRTELGILRENADAIIEQAGAPAALVELGAGSATKTRALIAPLLARHPRATYLPIDVSPTALAEAARQLRETFPSLAIHPVVAKYPEELGFLSRAPHPRLVLFLGSNIGNYEPAEGTSLLRAFREHLLPGDTLLLATDLRKDPAVLVPAYDDAAGVTARFNKNVLARLNRELGARFDLDAFRHVARWNARASRMEMHLESEAAQSVPIAALGLSVSFRAGEGIHTENSYKFTERMVRRMLKTAGFTWQRTFTDARRWFAVHLARV